MDVRAFSPTSVILFGFSECAAIISLKTVKKTYLRNGKLVFFALRTKFLSISLKHFVL